MLSHFQLGVFAVLCLGDFALLALTPRVRKAAGPEGRKRYPKRAFLIHAVGGLAGIVLGGLAVVAYLVGFDTVATTAALGQGVAITLLAGVSALPLSRHSSGYQGFNVVGYALYAVGWMVSGVAILLWPGIETAYACFVLTHAFLTCRVFVLGFPVAWRAMTGRTLDPDLNYSVATNLAAMVPLVLAWGSAGFAVYVAVTLVAFALHRIGVSSPWHARYEPVTLVASPPVGQVVHLKWDRPVQPDALLATPGLSLGDRR